MHWRTGALFIYSEEEGFRIEQTVLSLISVYGYIALFLSLVLGIVGLPIPDEVIMTYVGFLVSKGRLIFATALLVSFFGSVVGMSISYALGRYFGLSLLYKYGKRFGIHERHLQTVQSWYTKYGPFVLTIGYFIPGIRHVTAFSAGMGRLRISSFVLYAYAGGLIWVFTFISLGRLLGEHWSLLFVFLHHYGIWVLAGVLLIAAFMIWKRTSKRR